MKSESSMPLKQGHTNVVGTSLVYRELVVAMAYVFGLHNKTTSLVLLVTFAAYSAY